MYICYTKTPMVQKKARPIKSSNYLTKHATKSFDISYDQQL